MNLLWLPNMDIEGSFPRNPPVCCCSFSLLSCIISCMLPATYSPLGALEDNLPVWEWKSKGNIPYYFLPLASYKYLSFFLQLEMACVLNSLMIVFRYHTSLLIT